MGTPDQTAPRRIQLSRARGWRMPENTVRVDRATRWGNPWSVAKAREVGFTGTDGELAARCVGFFANALAKRLPAVGYGQEEVKALLRGKNLACWCRLCDAHRDGKPFGVTCAGCAPCHADVLGMAAGRFACDRVA